MSAVSQNILSSEMNTAHEKGYAFDVTLEAQNNWFDLPRITRALYVAQSRVRGLTERILQYEARLEAEKEARLKRGK